MRPSHTCTRAHHPHAHAHAPRPTHLHARAAVLSKVFLVLCVLQAADHPRVARRHARAKLLDLARARALHRLLKVDALAELRAKGASAACGCGRRAGAACRCRRTARLGRGDGRWGGGWGRWNDDRAGDRMCGWVDGWMGGWVDGWMFGWMDVWVGGGW
eukprot:89300-Chlamydomonas_euryale.AAC.1